MHYAQQAKYVRSVSPAALVDNTTVTSTAVDCKDAGYVEFIITLGATDIAMTVLKLEESDNNSDWSDVTGATFSGGKDTDGGTLALPSATDDNQISVFQVNKAGGKRKRYMRIAGTFGDGSVGGYFTAVARLSELARVPDVDTDIASGGVCRV